MKINVELKVELGGHRVDLVTNTPIDDIYEIIESLDNHDLRNLQKIGSGSYGNVYGFKDYAIKKLYDEEDSQNHDISVLKDLKHLECIPTLYAVIDDGVLIMERVYGRTVRQYCYENDNNNEYGLDDNFLTEWDKALSDVVKEGYSPDDLHESNVMIDSRTRKPRLVDVGWFFKHNEEYADLHKIKNNYGYKRAEMWTGDALKSYIKRQKRKAEREAELAKQLDVVAIKGNKMLVGKNRLVNL